MMTRPPSRPSRPTHAARMALSALLPMLVLAGCASPPVRFYTLGAPAIATGAVPVTASPLATATPVVEVGRIVLPDYLDGQDIVVRAGNQIERSAGGRWASRLSVGATDLITARLAQARTDLFVTDQPQPLPATWRLTVNISRLDVTRDGAAALDADWSIIPHDPHLPILRSRASLTQSGSAATDGAVATLTQALLDKLADRIVAGWPKG
ncbi:outer membrane lipoprotein [Gluconacetobacter johannae DSM 13595]|uniref:Membrane integrity-associated transporter subunit PqiC n=1 Tax=Gluconacetobacter johannae TaxID=112140 RepID=A0A7W4JA00_9PROT|nr:PqiC family protein [Gluconacetobacter johannae]MBB2177366.1 membrane integrity-associated transporter subunit PqiC [Gluconacetobacter johannae]GBQ81186.1 outer membrane lipoprotein [Gluconacetobacter johannae DSM 13595]